MLDKTEIRRSERARITSTKLSDLITDTNSYKSDFFKRIALVKTNPILPKNLFKSDSFLPIGLPLKDSLTPILHDLALKAREETNRRFQEVIGGYSQQHENENNERNLHQLIKAHYLYAEHLLVLVSFYSNCIIQSSEHKFINKVTAANKNEYRQHVERYGNDLFHQMNSILQLCDAASEEHQVAVSIKETYSTTINEINSKLEGLSNSRKRKNIEYSVAVKFMKPAPTEKEKTATDAEENNSVGTENQLHMSR